MLVMRIEICTSTVGLETVFSKLWVRRDLLLNERRHFEVYFSCIDINIGCPHVQDQVELGKFDP